MQLVINLPDIVVKEAKEFSDALKSTVEAFCAMAVIDAVIPRGPEQEAFVAEANRTNGGSGEVR